MKLWYIYVNTPRSLVDLDCIEVPADVEVPPPGKDWRPVDDVKHAIRIMASLLGEGYRHGREDNPF